MATYNTPTYDLQKPDRANPTRLLDSNVVSGTVEFAYIAYTVPASSPPVSGDTVKLCVLPADCTPVPALCKAVCNVSIGTTLTVNIGSAATPAGFANALPVGGVIGDIGFTRSTAAPAGWSTPTELPADTVNAANVNNGTTIQMVTTTVASLTANNTVYFLLAYKRGK